MLSSTVVVRGIEAQKPPPPKRDSSAVALHAPIGFENKNVVSTTMRRRRRISGSSLQTHSRTRARPKKASFLCVCFSLSLSKTVSRLSFVGGSVPLLSLSLSLCGALRRMQSSFLSGPFFPQQNARWFFPSHIKSRVFSALLSWTIHTHTHTHTHTYIYISSHRSGTRRPPRLDRRTFFYHPLSKTRITHGSKHHHPLERDDVKVVVFRPPANANAGRVRERSVREETRAAAAARETSRGRGMHASVSMSFSL